MAKKLGPCLYPLEPEEIEAYRIRLLEEAMEDGDVKVKVKAEERKPKIEKHEPKYEYL